MYTGRDVEVMRRADSKYIAWLEDELVAVMQTVAPGMGSPMPDEITTAIMVTAIRRLMEADVEKYEALLKRWQDRHAPEGKDNADD